MLLYPDADCAVYSANFEEMTATTESKMVWEGHGLLSWILDKESDKSIQVTGKRSRSNAAANDEDAVEVVLQLHPVSKCDLYSLSNQAYVLNFFLLNSLAFITRVFCSFCYRRIVFPKWIITTLWCIDEDCRLLQHHLYLMILTLPKYDASLVFHPCCQLNHFLLQMMDLHAILVCYLQLVICLLKKQVLLLQHHQLEHQQHLHHHLHMTSIRSRNVSFLLQPWIHFVYHHLQLQLSLQEMKCRPILEHHPACLYLLLQHC